LERFKYNDYSTGTTNSKQYGPDSVLFAQSEEATKIESFESTSPSSREQSAELRRLADLRRWFEDAVQARRDWDKVASSDYEFYYGKQWPNDVNPLNEGGRPNLTLNKIKAVVNAVIGYQTQNRYEPHFLPRTARDNKLAEIRKAVTKYILDQCDYSDIETRIFQDMIIGGIGWLYVGYKYDAFYPEGSMDIRRVSPFDVYVDPEARELDLSDAEFVTYATWQSKGKVARMFPEWADAIYGMEDDDDISEDPMAKPESSRPTTWMLYSKKKVRLCTCWYKTYETTEYIEDGQGGLIPAPVNANIPKNMIAKTESREVVRCATFIRDVLLEDIPSPYQNNMIPLIPLIGYFTNEGDVPAGIVRDVKDPQMEINKRRSQILHIINTSAFNGMLVEQGAMTKDQMERWRRFGSKPGMITEVTPGALEKIREITPKPLPDSIARLEQAFQSDIKDITGINEEMLGMDGPKSSSGRAIELRQRMAITQISLLFDNLRDFKLKFMYRLWGRGSMPGLVQQYYKEKMIIRITQDTEEAQFKTVNQPHPIGVDNDGNVLFQTINDLSAGEFDVVITESPSTPTKRYSDMLQFYELMKTPLGQVVSQLAPDLFLEYSDLPNKEKVAARLREAMGAQAQMQQGQMSGGMGQGSQANAPTPAQSQAQADGIDANV
jgi:hypothetical protein